MGVKIKEVGKYLRKLRRERDKEAFFYIILRLNQGSFTDINKILKRTILWSVLGVLRDKY